MITPLLKDDALIAEVLAASVKSQGFRLWWLGQSGFLIKSASGFTLIDPYLSDSLTKKYAGTARPHVRMTERCVDPSLLPFVTLVFSTHAHTDHFDRDTLRAIATAPGRFAPMTLALPAANLMRGRDMLGDLGVELVPIDAGQTITIRGLQVHAVPAAHTEIERDAEGRHVYLGFVLQLGAWRLYHSGDTVWHEQVLAAVRAQSPAIALLPINGHDPARNVAGNLDGAEAARFARATGVVMTIPHHFDLFAFNTASPDHFVSACQRESVPYTVLRCGGNWDSASLSKP